MLPILVCAALMPQSSGDTAFDIMFGSRAYGADDWAPLEDQWSYGLRVSRRFSASDFGWELGLSMSSDSEVLSDGVGVYDFELEFVELSGGLRWMPQWESPLQPYYATGVNWQDLELTVTDLFTGEQGTAGESSTGLYASAGLALSTGNIWRFGVDYRRVFGTNIETNGVEGDVDYGQLSGLFGFGF